MPSLRRLFIIFAFVAAATALGAEPVLPTSSDWGSGSVRWQVETGRVRGFLSGGECPSDGAGPAIEGRWQGDVLVGTVKLCQRGGGCADKAFPLFAFYMHSDGSLVADVKLDKDCSSPALKDGRLVLTAHLSEPSPQTQTQTSAPKENRREHRRGNSPSSSNSTQPASATLSGHLARGQQSLDRGDGQAAYDEFMLALDAQEDLAGAYLGLGESEMLMGKPRSALREYRKSLAARPDKVTYYNLACAQVKLNSRTEALDSLKKAIELGYDNAAALTKDQDLAPLREEPEFQRILALIWARQPTHRR
jgi:hypothetical protein